MAETRRAHPKKEKRKYIRAPRAENPATYAVLDEALLAHPELEPASIEIGWMIGNKADKDGHLVLGTMTRHTERARVLTGLDAVVALNFEAWQELSEPQRLALVDHELCHLVADEDNDGAQKVDGHGNLKWRIKKHDLEEFVGVVRRHGMWMDEVRTFVAAAMERKRAPLFAAAAAGEEPADLIGAVFEEMKSPRGKAELAKAMASVPAGTRTKITTGGGEVLYDSGPPADEEG